MDGNPQCSGGDAAAAVPILLLLLTPGLGITQAAALRAAFEDGWVVEVQASPLPLSLSLQAAMRWRLPGGATWHPAASRLREGQARAAASTPAGMPTAATTLPRAGSAGALVRAALLRACARFCMLGRRGLRGHKAGSRTRAVSARRAALSDAEGFHVAEHRRLLPALLACCFTLFGGVC